MKTALITILSLMSFTLFASDLASTMQEIEYSHNAKCVKTSVTRLGLSTGPLNSLNYSVNYHCVSNQGDFKVKVKLRESTNLVTGKRETKVKKVVFIK